MLRLDSTRMRSSLALLVLLAAPLAHAADARVEFLSKQLSTASDPRVRVNAAVGLGALGVPEAIAPLCAALKDSEAIVRGAAARALGDLADPNAIPCLRARKEPSKDVQLAIGKAIAALEAPKGLYLMLDPVQDEGGSLSADDLALAESLLRGELAKLGASFAPPGESKAAAASALRSKKLKGFMLKPKANGSGAGALELRMMVLTYPEQSIKGTVKVKASAKGAKPPVLLKVMVPKLVADAADEYGWKR